MGGILWDSLKTCLSPAVMGIDIMIAGLNPHPMRNLTPSAKKLGSLIVLAMNTHRTSCIDLMMKREGVPAQDTRMKNPVILCIVSMAGICRMTIDPYRTATFHGGCAIFCYSSKKLMRSEQRFCQAASFEQRKAQEDRVPHAPPDGAGNIVAAQRNSLYQYRIDPHTNHNQKCLKA